MNLLIVDDEAKIRNGLRKHLEGMSLRFDVIETAENAHIALEIARRIQPEIILVDIRMPGMDGLEFLEIVSGELSGFKAIVISGYDDFAYAQKAIRCGVNEYVLKPLDLPKFDTMITRIYNELLEERGQQNRASGANVYSKAVLKTKRFIEQNYFREDLSLQSTADELSVNPSHLSRQMRLQLGMGFVDYLTAYRMEKACSLLQSVEKDVKIYEISRHVGYSSQHYFTRVFTNHFGMSPLQYRALRAGEGTIAAAESTDREAGGI